MGASHQGLGIQSTIFEKIAKIKSEPLEVIFEESCQLSDILGPEKKPKIEKRTNKQKILR